MNFRMRITEAELKETVNSKEQFLPVQPLAGILKEHIYFDGGRKSTN